LIQIIAGQARRAILVTLKSEVSNMSHRTIRSILIPVALAAVTFGAGCTTQMSESDRQLLINVQSASNAAKADAAAARLAAERAAEEAKRAADAAKAAQAAAQAATADAKAASERSQRVFEKQQRK
jgi:hypothetical protein